MEDEARAELAQERADETARERAEQRRLKRKLKAEEDVQSGKKPAKKSRRSKPKPKPTPKENEGQGEEDEVEDEGDLEGDEEVLMYTCNEDDTCAMIAEDMEIDVQELVDMNKPRFGKGGRVSGALPSALQFAAVPDSRRRLYSLYPSVWSSAWHFQLRGGRRR